MTQEGRADVVEVLLSAHIETRHVLSVAETLAQSNATPSTGELAAQVADYLEWLLPLHHADEDESLAPRLKGKHPVVDEALVNMARQHLALQGPLARLKLLCRQVASDTSRLHALRFEVGSAVGDLRARLKEHEAMEESIVFPALKRTLYVDELDSISDEMKARRAVA
jgi:hemerythrin-like domain-containing protein